MCLLLGIRFFGVFWGRLELGIFYFFFREVRSEFLVMMRRVEFVYGRRGVVVLGYVFFRGIVLVFIF